MKSNSSLTLRMSVDKIERTWFSDEKIFTVQTPTNTQNDRVYARVLKKRDVTHGSVILCRQFAVVN